MYRPSKTRFWVLGDLRMKKMMMVRRAARMQVSLRMRSRSSKRCRSRFSARFTLPCFEAALQQNGLLYTVHATLALLKVLSPFVSYVCVCIKGVSTLVRSFYTLLTCADMKDLYVNGH